MAGAEARQTVTDPFSCFRVMHRAYWDIYCALAAGVAQDPQGSVLDCPPHPPTGPACCVMGASEAGRGNLEGTSV